MRLFKTVYYCSSQGCCPGCAYKVGEWLSDKAVLTLRGWHLSRLLSPRISFWDLGNFSTIDPTTVISGRLPVGNVLILLRKGLSVGRGRLNETKKQNSLTYSEFFRLLFRQFHKIITLITARIIAYATWFHIRSSIIIWNISYITSRFLKAHYNPQLTSSQCPFIAQLVRVSHQYHEVTGSSPVDVLNFSGFYIHNCINCVSN